MTSRRNNRYRGLTYERGSVVSLVSLGANSSIRCVSTYIDVVGVDVIRGGVIFDGLKNNPRVVIWGGGGREGGGEEDFNRTS